jgi:hypothetical protein
MVRPGPGRGLVIGDPVYAFVVLSALAIAAGTSIGIVLVLLFQRDL